MPQGTFYLRARNKMSFLLQIRFSGSDFVGFHKKSSMYLLGTPPGFLFILLVSLQKSNFRYENHFVKRS